MEQPISAQAADDARRGAIDLMAKMAVLIVAALLFAGYGIREGQSQPVNGAKARSPTTGKAERTTLRRAAIDGRIITSLLAAAGAQPPMERRH